MNAINKYKTPYKLNKPILTGSGKEGEFDYHAVDCPFVFFHQNLFHMLYIGFDGIGYQTALAVSEDLIRWKTKGVVLAREEHVGWDQTGAAGTWIIKNDNLNELPILKKVNNKYWMIYHSYPRTGYEAGAAEMGLAWCEDEDLMEWHRLPNPIFSWENGRDWEQGGLYKACIIEKDNQYYMFYNAKNLTNGDWKEQIGLAVSDNLLTWKRYEKNPILKIQPNTWESKFCSDPCVMYDDKMWVMFYFGFDGNHAQEGIAVSEDLLHWEKYSEPIIKNGKEGELDELHAHKPSIIKYNDVLYHLYCACGKYKATDRTKNFDDEFRCITLASSRPL
ncbi:hypothetical protein AN1V17_23700 [Vallitalea sediminicola]